MVKKLIISGGLIEMIEYEKEKEFKKGLRITRKNAKRVFGVHAKRRGNNIRTVQRSFVRKVCCVVAEYGKPLFVTLTFAENVYVLSEALVVFRKFNLRMSKAFIGYKYVAVPEFQKRGAVHFHCFMWGLPSELGDVKKGNCVVSYGLERSNRVVQKIWGVGFVDVVRSDGSLKHINYLAKYMTVCLSDYRLLGRRAYYSTRYLPKPLVIPDVNVDYFLDRLTLNCINSYQVQSKYFGLIKYNFYER